MREQLIKEVEIIPLEVVVRNIAAGSLAKRLGMEEGTVLPRSIIEFYYKADALDDPMVRKSTSRPSAGRARRKSTTSWLWPFASTTSSSGLFMGIGIQLVDFKIECGRLFEGDMMRIVVADEISPDSCRLWDVATQDKLDKDRFRRDMGGLVEAYQEVARRLGIMNENEPLARPARCWSSTDISVRPAIRPLRHPAPAPPRRRQPVIKARITVTLKNGVLDPQGKAIEGALGSLGFFRRRRRAPGQGVRHRARPQRQGPGRGRPQGHVRQASGEYGDREL